MGIRERLKAFISRLEGEPEEYVNDSVPTDVGSESFDISAPDELPEDAISKEESVAEEVISDEENETEEVISGEEGAKENGSAEEDMTEAIVQESAPEAAVEQDIPETAIQEEVFEGAVQETEFDAAEENIPEESADIPAKGLALPEENADESEEAPLSVNEANDEVESGADKTRENGEDIRGSEKREKPNETNKGASKSEKKVKAVKAEKAEKGVKAAKEDKGGKASKQSQKFVPSRASRQDLSSYDLAKLQALKEELEREAKRERRLDRLSLVWTLLSTIFAIASTCVYVGKKWVDSVYSYILVAMLALYIGVFIGLLIFAFQNPSKNSKRAKSYKKVLSIFKTFVNLSFLIITAVDMAALASSHDLGFMRWLMFAATFLVAAVQFAIKVALLVVHAIRKSVSRRYTVQVKTYENGAVAKRTKRDKRKERRYR